jgi:hypothetical protein
MFDIEYNRKLDEREGARDWGKPTRSIIIFIIIIIAA